MNLSNLMPGESRKKLSRLLCVTALSTCSVFAYAQQQQVKLTGSNLPLKSVFKQIEKQTDLSIDYRSQDVDDSRIVKQMPKATTVQQAMNQLLAGTDCVVTFSNGHIIIKKQASNTTNQQSKLVKGTIVDATGMPVIGANVMVKGTTNGTITDMDGKFSLDVDEGATLVVSYIGFANQEIKVGNQTNLSIALKEDSKALDELVVVGYGTQKKVNLTGAVDALKGEQLQNRPTATITQTLQGQVSGANFTAGNAGFEPGADLTFQIRGQGNAYVLVDGVPSDLSRVNPNDIESISVLKDAAAASIYGARASYGVVLVITKSGRKDEKPVINFSANVTASHIHRLPQMVDSYTFARMLNEAGDNGGGRVFDNETIDRIIAYQKDPTLPETVPHPNNPTQWGDLQYPNANYDWFEELYGNALSNQENISIRGGNKKVSYFASAGHVYNDSNLKYGTDYYRRINTTAKIDVKLTDWWDFSFYNRFMSSDRTKPNMNNEGDYDLIFHQIARTMPTQAKYTPNGRYTKHSKILWMEDGGTDVNKVYEMVQRFSTVIRPIKNWDINIDYTYKFINDRFDSNNFIVYEDLVDGTLVPESSTLPSYVQKYQNVNLYNSLNAYTSYNLSLKDKHNFSVMLGLQYEGDKSEKIEGRKNDILNDNVPSFSTSTGNIHLLNDELNHISRFGSFFRFGYNYKEKYLLEVNGRYDGSSVLTTGHRWAFFPSVSLGWNVAREKFFENLTDKISNFKIRGSWGSLGNQNIDPYQDLALLGINSNLAWILNGSRPIYVTSPNLVNTLLTWETAETLDFGVDLSLLNNRLNITGDWYQRNTRDRLGPAEALPAVIGADIPKKNNSELRTNGWELAISWRDRINEDFSYSVSAMIYDYYSTVTKYNNPTNILSTDYTGKRVGEIWGYTTEGLIQTQEEADQIMQSDYQKFFHSVWNTGDVKYADLNNDGVVNNGKNTLEDHGDLSVIGNTTPRYQFSFTLGAEYKNFDFSMMWQGVAKRDLWLDSNMFWGFTTWNQSSLFVNEHLDYYRDQEADTYIGLGVNTDAYFPRPYLNTNSSLIL